MFWIGLAFLLLYSCTELPSASSQMADFSHEEALAWNTRTLEGIQSSILWHILFYYDMRVPPKPNNRSAITVWFEVALVQLQELHEQDSTLKAMVIYKEYWHDHRLRWDPKAFNETYEVNVPSSKIWTPEIGLLNGFHTEKVLEEPRAFTRHDGFVTLLVPMRVTANCPLDFTAFPYDSQKCNLTFGTWSYHAHDVVLGPSQTEGATLDRYHENPKWKLLNSTSYFHYKNYKGAPFSEYTVVLKLKRQSTQYSIKLVVPAVVTSLFVLITFLLPSGSGEKIVLCAILLLCLLILMLYVNMSLPGDASTMLGCFLSFDIFLVFFAALVAAAMYNMHYGFGSGNDEGGSGEKSRKIRNYYRKGIVIRVIDLIFFLIFLAVFIVGAIIILRYWY